MTDTPGWGDVEAGDDGGSPEGEYHIPGEIDLGGGFKLVMAPDAFRKIMHTPEITARVDERCRELCDTANELAVEEGAVYEYFVSNNPENIRARGRVKTGNVKAMVDDAVNSTLLKALATVGSDPKPSYGGQNAPEQPEATPEIEAEEEGGEE